LVGVHLRNVHDLGYNTSRRPLAGTAWKVGGGVRVSVSSNALVDSLAVGLRIHHVIGLEGLRVECGRGW
jgi:hypothetical protein